MSFQIFLLSICIAAACAHSLHPFSSNFNDIVLIPALVARSNPIWPFGLVKGIRECGSDGKLGSVYVTDCTRVPCHLMPHSNYDIAIQFTASVTSDSLALYVFMEDNANEPIINMPILGEIQQGILYELKFILPVSSEFAGREFAVYMMVVDVLNERAEICAMADVTVGTEKQNALTSK